jgi:hypothetical protein
MGLDMYLARYHKPDITKEHFNLEETEDLQYGENDYNVLSILPDCFKNIAKKVTITNQYYNMKKISEDFANGEDLTIGGSGDGLIYFRNYEKEIKLDLKYEQIENGYLINKEEDAYVVQGDYEVAYWRKANQIRQWFVNHIEEFNEDDNCGHYNVTKELLERLIIDCQCVLLSREKVEVDDKIKKKMDKVKTLSERGVGGEKDGAKDTLEKMERKYGLTGISVKPEEIMPTSSGFFFGGTEYNDRYYNDLKLTINMCQEVIDETDWDTEIVVYTEWW